MKPRMLDQLRDQGLDTSWYTKHKVLETNEPAAPSKCSWFSVYILDGDHAWTKTWPTENTPSEPFKVFRTLENPVKQRCFYCSGCKVRFADYDEAMAHLDESHGEVAA